MKKLHIASGHPIRGTLRVPGDKSISHRALILGALANGENRVQGWLSSGDTRATLEAVGQLGIEVQHQGDGLYFQGGQLHPALSAINCRNAGTCMRLMAGLLAGQPFKSVLDGSPQLRQRPMKRITRPLTQMGATITDEGGCAPLTIHPAPLTGIAYEPPVASAQVKSALLLAGLQAQGTTTIIEPGTSRDHTERMLSTMGADIDIQPPRVSVTGGDSDLVPVDLTVPGDISSAAFIMVGALLAPDSEVTIMDIGVNPTRTGVLDILSAMGVQPSLDDQHDEGGEPVGTISIVTTDLQATTISGDRVVRAIDELPVIAVAATQADGETIIKDAAELRVKEVDRIALVASELRKLGAHIEEQPDGLIIEGPTPLKGAVVNSHGDHRLGMALAIAGLAAQGETIVQNAECIDDSFPGFTSVLSRLGAKVGES